MCKRRRRFIPVPTLDLKTAQPLGLLARKRTRNGLVKVQNGLRGRGPGMPFAIELVRRLLDYFAPPPSPARNGVDAVLQPDIDRLRVLAPTEAGLAT